MLIDVEAARARGQSERDGFVYIDLTQPAARRVLRWQALLLTEDGMAPEWTSVARWQVARALTLLGYTIPEQPVRYSTGAKFQRSGDFRTRLALVPSIAIACVHEAQQRGLTFVATINQLVMSLPDEAPVLPERMTREQLQNLYRRNRTARQREIREAIREGRELTKRKSGRTSQLERDAEAVGTLLVQMAPPKQDIYSERFLLLCREREARDKWLMKGGRGKEPPSTVDDHLGRTRHAIDADKRAWYCDPINAAPTSMARKYRYEAAQARRRWQDRTNEKQRKAESVPRNRGK